MQYTQVLKDGIPIHADQFGYPEAYYVPPLQTVDRIEFVHGGGALQYGPQPGGALNYVTHRPRTDKELGGGTENTFGEDNTWNSFSYADGTNGRVGHYFYYNRRETDGFRSANSDVRLDAYNLTLALDATSATRWFLNVESYREEHGEPGGLTAADFASNPGLANRTRDRFSLDRDAVSLTVEHDLLEGQITGRFWAVDYARASARQRVTTALSGTTVQFGTAPGAAELFSNELQEFRTYGADTRYRRDWGSESRHVFTAGAQIYTSDSPRRDDTSATAFVLSSPTRIAQRDMFYLPVFAENLFRFGDLSITPGVRVETFRQKVSVEPNATAPDRIESDAVPLFGLGVAYELTARGQVYANVSESYRPVIFTEAVPTAAGTTVASDLEEGRAVQYEVGYRAQPLAGLTLDASVFQMVFADKIGTSAGVVQNLGRAEYCGVEFAAQYDLLRLAGGDGKNQLNALLNVTLLDAEYTDGPAKGNVPAYAADHLVRTGLIYGRGEDLKLALLGTLVDESFGFDNNTPTASVPVTAVPAYAIWDMTVEYCVPGTPLTLLGGVNNLLDESYYSRVRTDGIDPAAGRTFYAGFRAEF
jgi:Fe(3+) dicitrate transport protein